MLRQLLISIYFAFFVSLPVLAAPLQVVVRSSESSKEFTIQFSTPQYRVSTCRLTVVDLTLVTPGSEFIDGVRVPSAGKIEASARVVSGTGCYHSPGPHYGDMTFQIGHGLPELSEGRYQLIINGDSLGFLRVDREEGVLLEGNAS